MPFDPTKPANNSPVNSTELRSQLTSLKALIDDRSTTAVMQSYVLANSGGNVASVGLLDTLASSPPTAAELQEVINKVNELITVLQRV